MTEKELDAYYKKKRKDERREEKAKNLLKRLNAANAKEKERKILSEE
jgi:hypothetical protein